MKPRMKPSAVYRKAAEHIAVGAPGGGDAACGAIRVILNTTDTTPEVAGFQKLYKPKNIRKEGFYWGSTMVAFNQDCRVLALLLMSEIAKESE